MAANLPADRARCGVPEVGETIALLRDWADVAVNPFLGLYGAVVVGPQGRRRGPIQF